MKVWMFVEGKSDSVGLKALFNSWQQDLDAEGWGIRIVPLKSKFDYFKLIGVSVTEKLLENQSDIVVGLPDLYPCRNFNSTKYKHENFGDIVLVQNRLVKESLNNELEVRDRKTSMARFYASALKHDLEMLLLSAYGQLCNQLGSGSNPRRIRCPENQNQDRPPKKVVSEYFRRYSSKSYQEARDAPAILRKASLREVVLTEEGTPRCPTFKEMLDWVGEKTGVPAYRP